MFTDYNNPLANVQDPPLHCQQGGRSQITVHNV